MIYRFCPICGRSLVYQKKDGEEVPVCQNKNCGFIFWQNSKPCVSVIIPNDEKRILITVRARDPERGKLDLPGGFLQAGEHPDDGVKREIQEELGVELAVVDYLGFAIDRYGPDGNYTLNIGAIGKITSGTPQAADDAEAIEWIDPQTIDHGRLAFTNNAHFLKLWLDRSDHP